MPDRLPPRARAAVTAVHRLRINHYGDGSEVLLLDTLDEIAASLCELTETAVAPRIATSNEQIATCRREVAENERLYKRAPPDERRALLDRIDRDMQVVHEARVRLALYERAARDVRIGGCRAKTTDGGDCGNANLIWSDACGVHLGLRDSEAKPGEGGKKGRGGKRSKR